MPSVSSEPMEAAKAYAAQTGAVFIHPFDDPVVIAGAGTVGLEILEDVPDVDTTRTDDAELVAAVAAEQEGLGETGRVLLRPSGTEPLVRVMVEAASSGQARTVADRLADVVRRRLAL